MKYFAVHIVLLGVVLFEFYIPINVCRTSSSGHTGALLLYLGQRQAIAVVESLAKQTAEVGQEVVNVV